MRASRVMLTLVVSGLVVPCSTAVAQPLVSTFDSSAEGWTVETRQNPAQSFALSGVFTPDYLASGGLPGGRIREVDPDNQWSFFRAPTSWGGNRSEFYGKQLRYTTRTNVNNYPDGRLVVMISASGQIVSHDAGVPNINEWTTRTVNLAEGDWYIGANGMGTLATQSQILAVMSELATLYIGLEFGGDTAEEAVDLDTVSFGTCIGDIADDFGTLSPDGQVSFGDFLALLGLVGPCPGAPGCTGDIADDFGTLNDGDGQVSFGDFLALLGLVGACP